MKNFVSTIVILLIVSTMFYGCRELRGPLAPDDGALWPRVASGSRAAEYGQAVDLLAGQKTVVGSVRCWIKGGVLHVKYTTEGGWMLAETQMTVVASAGDIPLAGGKNPSPGRFPFKREHRPQVSEYEYSFLLADRGLDNVDDLVIAAHAEVVLQGNLGVATCEEGAWAVGRPLPPTDAGNNDARETVPHEKSESGNDRIDRASASGGNWAMYFTVSAYAITVNELKINEVFFAGSCGSTFYFYDQFVELYNSSTDTLYLDGIILTRQSQVRDDQMENVNYVKAIYAYQFPGTPVTGRECPIAPGQFVVIAADAIDHRQHCANSVDLSLADWECYNPLGNDYDNPLVPNIVNIMPTVSVDYMINLVHNGIVIATGSDYTYEQNVSGSNYLLIPIRTVIDGVEYSSQADAARQMTIRVDAGYAGLGLTRYCAQSTERVSPGFDTNNSTNDFMNPAHPTPGYGH